MRWPARLDMMKGAGAAFFLPAMLTTGTFGHWLLGGALDEHWPPFVGSLWGAAVPIAAALALMFSDFSEAP